LVRFGNAESTADEHASVLLAALEGALILARAQHSIHPLDKVQRFFTTSFTPTAGQSRAAHRKT
jgi:hypothetical protein